jgi:hypothetical protein
MPVDSGLGVRRSRAATAHTIARAVLQRSRSEVAVFRAGLVGADSVRCSTHAREKKLSGRVVRRARANGSEDPAATTKAASEWLTRFAFRFSTIGEPEFSASRIQPQTQYAIHGSACANFRVWSRKCLTCMAFPVCIIHSSPAMHDRCTLHLTVCTLHASIAHRFRQA